MSNTQLSHRDDAIRTLRFAQASILRAQAEQLRIPTERAERYEDSQKAIDECTATFLELQAEFIVRYSVKTLEELL